MKYLLSTGIILVFCTSSFAQQLFKLFSPDSSLRLEVNTADKLSYSLYAGTTVLVSSSSVDLLLGDDQQLSGNIIVAKHKYSKTNETVIVPIPYRRNKIDNQYNQLGLIFKKPFTVEFRLYNNGMAYRIGTRFKDSIIIKNETAKFDIDKNAVTWFPYIDKRPDIDRYHTSFEGPYKKETLSAIADTMLTFAPVVHHFQRLSYGNYRCKSL